MTNTTTQRAMASHRECLFSAGQDTSSPGQLIVNRHLSPQQGRYAMTIAYLTDYRDADREDLESIAAEAASEALAAAGVTFEQAMHAEGCRCEGEPYDAAHAAAYRSATDAAQRAFLSRMPPHYCGGAFVSLGCR